ncbi:MAG: transposase [Verrucomicrobia bacterium]|nr:transposase [Verrucomicrobiota bacterium]
MFKTQLLEQFPKTLTPEDRLELTRRHRWHQRTGKIRPAEFLLGQVCGQLSALHPSLSAQTRSCQNPGSRQAADARYNASAVDYFQAALREKCRTYGSTPTAQALEMAGWLILVTNVPAAQLPVRALGYLYRVRWQIELIFKHLAKDSGLGRYPKCGLAVGEPFR